MIHGRLCYLDSCTEDIMALSLAHGAVIDDEDRENTWWFVVVYSYSSQVDRVFCWSHTADRLTLDDWYQKTLMNEMVLDVIAFCQRSKSSLIDWHHHDGAEIVPQGGIIRGAPDWSRALAILQYAKTYVCSIRRISVGSWSGTRYFLPSARDCFWKSRMIDYKLKAVVSDLSWNMTTLYRYFGTHRWLIHHYEQLIHYRHNYKELPIIIKFSVHTTMKIAFIYIIQIRSCREDLIRNKLDCYVDLVGEYTGPLNRFGLLVARQEGRGVVGVS